MSNEAIASGNLVVVEDGPADRAGLLPEDKVDVLRSLKREGQVAMVGDSTHDLHAGRAAGMTTIGVLTGPATEETLAPFADAVLPDISHLPAWLNARDP